MPTYEYECPAGHIYEKREGFDAPATQRCAECRRMAKRVLYAPPIVFKGSGFYVTDSRKSSSATESDVKPDTKGEPKGESKGEAKTQAKTETPSSDTSSSSKDAEPAAAG